MSDSIFREPTDIERQTMRLLNSTDFAREFRKRNVEAEQSYVIKHKPYCFRCAKIDFEKALTGRVREATKNADGGKVSQKELNKIYDVNLDKYGKESYFRVHRVEPVIETKLLDGIKQETHTNYCVHYRCQPRNCRVSIFVPKAEYEAREKQPKSDMPAKKA